MIGSINTVWANEYPYKNSSASSHVSREFVKKSIFRRRLMKWIPTIVVTFFNPHELTKIVLQSYTKFYCRIVFSPKRPPSIFWWFATMDVKNFERAPFQFFWHCETFCFYEKRRLKIGFKFERSPYVGIDAKNMKKYAISEMRILGPKHGS